MRFTTVILCTTFLTATANAEQSFSVYGGIQEVDDSTADFVDIDGSSYEFPVSWDGNSFEMPPYYGFRYTRWQSERFGVAVDFTHSKAYATDSSLEDSGFGVLEFTDGINVLTLNGIYRVTNASQITPYFGAGLGISIPHVEIKSPLMSEKAFEYQWGGLAVTTFVGLDYKLNENWSLFGELKFDYTKIDVDVSDNGNFQTELLTQALNFGVTYSW